jgi:serine/threonine protein kinase
VPKVWWYGIFETNYQALVIDLYDTSLRDVVKKNNGSLAMSTIGNVARQLLPILENIHNHSIVHRDIKPHNIGVKVRGGSDDTKIMPRRDSFLLQQSNEYYFFDFGISKTFLSDDNKHIRFRDDRGMYSVNKVMKNV